MAEQMDLVVLDSGASQHVLIDPRDPSHVWKIPAVCNRLLPTPVSVSTFKPAKRWKAVLWNRVRQIAPTTAVAPLSALLAGRASGKRVRRFGRMVDLLRRLRCGGHHSAILPFRVVEHVRIRAVSEHGPIRYRGPALIQRRADTFVAGRFEHRFDSESLIRIQRHLWSVGVGLDDGSAVLGPHDWALLDGRVYLGDTGSLTEDARAVHRTLDSDVLERAAAFLLRRCGPVHRSEAELHIARVRTSLTPEVLTALWRTRFRSSPPPR